MTDFTPENLTDDQIITLLQMLFANMNNLDKVYYDLFINTIPMDITLERYDENGTLQTYIIPNRAKDKAQVYLGQGSPEGVQDAKVGSFYLDILNSNIYAKIKQTERYGWFLLFTSNNFRANIDYLTPTGNGSGLTNLNVANVSSGILSPVYGGTGTTGLTGILKGNGTNPCTVAEAGIDYLIPTAFTGMIGTFAGITAPDGWLIADGMEYRIADYQNLYDRIGTTYNDGTEIAGYFRVPDLRGVFIRGYDNGSRGLDVTSFTATLTANSNILSNISNEYIGLFAVGLRVTGDGIPNNTEVVAISQNSITLSNIVTSSGQKTLNLIGRRFGSYQPDAVASTGSYSLNISYRNYDGYPSGDESVRAVANVSLSSSGSSGGDNHPKNISLLTCIKY